jgi:outer membrane protein OmpA-like peptidoglycan-associated protein
MRIRITAILAFLLLALCNNSFAQLKEFQSKNKKALKHFEEGKKYYEKKEDGNAIVSLKKSISADPQFIDPHMILGTIYYDARDFSTAAIYFKKAIEINPRYSSTNYYSLGSSYFKLGKYEEAIPAYKALLSFGRVHPELEKLGKRDLANCEFGAKAVRNPVKFDPKNLGASINTDEHEYFPAITGDEQTFLFTRNRRITNSRATQEDFYISNKENGQWQPSVNIGAPINTPMNEGAPALSADGLILIFTACEIHGDYGPDRRGYGSCDLFYTKRVGKNWVKPRNLGAPVNTQRWESQPSFSSDGKSLYFLAKRNGGYGDSDIWLTELQEDGTWSEPKNLGPKINTPGKEESVFIHSDNQTLYFASDGHVGMGGTDIYMSRRDENGEWGEPVNLGYPINTQGDENSLLVGATGEIAYFASDRDGGFGGLDIYSFEMPEHAKPYMVTYMKGKVFDKETTKPLEARFELIDLETGKVIVESFSNPGDGEFLVALPVNKNYALNASRGGYLFYSENFSLKSGGTAAKPTHRDVPLQPIKEGEVVVLKNVFFETASSALKTESKVELNKLVEFLQRNKTIKIELGGHTDNVGDKKANVVLSNNRGQSVADYLVEKGISSDRLSYKGYGDSQPVADNNTDEGRALNRRTEFKIVAK